MKGPSDRRAVDSKPSKRSLDEDDYIEIAGPSNHAKRPNASAGPSRRVETIVIDDDEDEDEEEAYHAGNFGAGMMGRKVEVKVDASASGGIDHFEAREAVRIAMSKLDAEMNDVRGQIEPLQALLVTLQAERRGLETQLSALHQLSVAPSRQTHSSSRQQAAPVRNSKTDYQTDPFPWSASLVPLAKSTFGIQSFRLCQEGVINAAIDDRDIVCVMPTGGGKSLTYQLPAVLGKRGLTVVISPLLALIWDQVRALKEIGVEAVMLTGGTSKEEQNDIFRRMEKGETNGEKVIRLVYLTPEKVSKSKRLISALEKANSAGRLRRFVIDEAHCCSQLGHDFRPDYKNLSMLKALFPRVPIQAVTLPDLLKILRLGPICNGREATPNGTVFFTAPLYRPNLHYKVLPKPSSAKAAIEAMGQWIQDNHAGKSGIIYCLSKKDTETVSDALRQWSGGKIKAGMYHAGMDDAQKEQIHLNWRRGIVNCICATIAFGLGIDKGDVRYVIHHSMSKSLDGYYQETGRAGRDGKDSDCVLFYRGQDAARLAGLIYADVDGTGKLHEMMRFAQDLQTCRKVAFAKYFSTSANLSANAWDNAATLDTSSTGGTLTTCGICDNCTRSELTIAVRDVTLDSWKVLKVLEAVRRERGRMTVQALGDLVRGMKKGTFAVPEGEKKKATGEAFVDIGEIIEEKVKMSKDDMERLIIHLVLIGYLQEDYHPTTYSVNVYLEPAARALRLSRLTAEQIEDGNGVKLECAFPCKESKNRGGSKKRARKEVVELLEEDQEEIDVEDDGDGIDGDEEDYEI